MHKYSKQKSVAANNSSTIMVHITLGILKAANWQFVPQGQKPYETGPPMHVAFLLLHWKELKKGFQAITIMVIIPSIPSKKDKHKQGYITLMLNHKRALSLPHLNISDAKSLVEQVNTCSILNTATALALRQE